MQHSLSSLEQAVTALQERKFVVLYDDLKEQEGDLIVAAQYATADHLTFLMRYTSRFICVPLLPERYTQLGLSLQTAQPTDPSGCRPCVTVDAKESGTGWGAQDRSKTIAALVSDPVSVYHSSSQLKIPGHTTPLLAYADGLLARKGHTEGSLDLLRIAGLQPMAVIAELIDERTQEALQGNDVYLFSSDHRLPLVTMSDLTTYVSSHQGPAPFKSASRLLEACKDQPRSSSSAALET